MSVRNLESFFRPSSVALVGASVEPSSVGAVIARNLLRAGYGGPVMPVNPEHRSVRGVLAYPDVDALPETPELAVVAVPAPQVPDVVRGLGARGTRAVAVVSAGFAETGEEEGEARQEALLAAAREHGVRILGPNCLGLVVPGSGLDGSFAHLPARPGEIAFLAQSGALVTAVLDWADARGIGFSHLVSLGNMTDVDFGDLLDYLALERQTRGILLYVESVTDARKFMSAARAAARSKPVVVVKGGRHGAGARAATSHTGALAGSDAVYDAAFRRAGLLRVRELGELFDAVETLGAEVPVGGDRLAILTNGGGFGVLAADALVEAGGRLAEIDEATLTRLDELLPAAWSGGNPVDILGDAPPERYGEALEAVSGAAGVDAVLVLHSPTAVTSSSESARAVARAVHRCGGTVLTSWMGETAVAEARRILADERVSTYDTPEEAIRAFMHMVAYHRNQEMLRETPPSLPGDVLVDPERAGAVIEGALDEGREWLTQAEAKDVLRAYGIPVVATRATATPEEAADAARAIGAPVALKVLSPDVSHKSDVGGVRVGVAPEEVVEAARTLRETVEARAPEAELRGFTVEPALSRSDAYELIVGVTEDPVFGPAILFGHGGPEVEVVGDTAIALPPLNANLARELMERTRIHRRLAGFRDREAVDLDAVARALIQVSRLVTDLGAVAELDVNPLLARTDGVLALDARVRVRRTETPGADRLAIRPYPRELEETLPAGGRELLLRPIRPEDEPEFQRTFGRLSPEEVRMRFFSWKQGLSHTAAARLTQIDYDREMALVLVGDEGRIHGVVRLVSDPDREAAEFSVLVEKPFTGQGLGRRLMEKILSYARERGVGVVYGDVLRENRRMLGLARALGFSEEPLPENPGVVRVSRPA